MPKYNNFNPKGAIIKCIQGDYSLYTRTKIGKYLLVKGGKVLNYTPSSGIAPGPALANAITSYEYNAKRDLELLRAKIAKAEAHIQDILEVYEEVQQENV